MRSGILTTAEDLRWLRETHLKGVPLPAKYQEFKAAVVQGNEDAPWGVNLYVVEEPKFLDDFLRIRFLAQLVGPPFYCEYIEYDGKTDKPKWTEVKR